MNDKKLAHDQPPESIDRSPISIGIGAIAGGVTGAALGRLISGKAGVTVSGVAGAIAGSIAGNALVEFAETVIEEASSTLGLGADTKSVELPRHYSWDELQALSKAEG